MEFQKYNVKEKKKRKKKGHKKYKNIFRTFSGFVVGIGSVHFRLVPWSDLYFSRSIGPFLCTQFWPQGFNLLPVASKAFPSIFFCLLVSSVSGFRTDTNGTVVNTFFFLGSLVQSCCGEGGMLQTSNTGVCSQCLSHTGSVPAHSACSLPAHTA